MKKKQRKMSPEKKMRSVCWSNFTVKTPLGKQRKQKEEP